MELEPLLPLPQLDVSLDAGLRRRAGLEPMSAEPDLTPHLPFEPPSRAPDLRAILDLFAHHAEPAQTGPRLPKLGFTLGGPRAGEPGSPAEVFATELSFRPLSLPFGPLDRGSLPNPNPQLEPVPSSAPDVEGLLTGRQPR